MKTARPVELSRVKNACLCDGERGVVVMEGRGGAVGLSEGYIMLLSQFASFRVGHIVPSLDITDVLI